MTTLFALVFVLSGNAMASDDKPTIAVFTKNTTNPAYQAFRIAADQIGRSAGAKILHFVPKQPWLVPMEQRTCPEWSEFVR